MIVTSSRDQAVSPDAQGKLAHTYVELPDRGSCRVIPADDEAIPAPSGKKLPRLSSAHCVFTAQCGQPDSRPADIASGAHSRSLPRHNSVRINRSIWVRACLEIFMQEISSALTTLKNSYPQAHELQVLRAASAVCAPALSRLCAAGLALATLPGDGRCLPAPIRMPEAGTRRRRPAHCRRNPRPAGGMDHPGCSRPSHAAVCRVIDLFC